MAQGLLERQLRTDERKRFEGLNVLNQVYDHIHKMRVVPFDLRSFSELVGSALGPLMPLLPYVVDISQPWLKGH
ncbi:MAG TPA: hypothetical protein VM842_08465 [Nitrospira sp.]|jgi:hypothetical protein|nr:hypothetical protein [Nitrospira sp.]